MFVLRNSNNYINILKRRILPLIVLAIFGDCEVVVGVSLRPATAIFGTSLSRRSFGHCLYFGRNPARKPLAMCKTPPVHSGRNYLSTGSFIFSIKSMAKWGNCKSKCPCVMMPFTSTWTIFQWCMWPNDFAMCALISVYSSLKWFLC